MRERSHDFSPITELPGRKVGRDQCDVICRRYDFAGQFVGGRRVLEVGCGPGLGLGYLAQRARLVVGGDLTASNVRRAQHTYKGRDAVELLRMNAHTLPFKDGAFDVVLAMATIYYLDFDVFLRECRRVLNSNGLFIFCTPNKNVPSFGPSWLSTAYYSPPELLEILTRFGFAVDMFGVFPVPRAKDRWVRRLIAMGGNVLRLLDFAPGVKERVKDIIRRVIGYETYILPGELAEGEMNMVHDIPIRPLSLNPSDLSYRVFYGLARVSKTWVIGERLSAQTYLE